MTKAPLLEAPVRKAVAQAIENSRYKEIFDEGFGQGVDEARLSEILEEALCLLSPRASQRGECRNRLLLHVLSTRSTAAILRHLPDRGEVRKEMVALMDGLERTLTAMRSMHPIYKHILLEKVEKKFWAQFGDFHDATSALLEAYGEVPKRTPRPDAFKVFATLSAVELLAEFGEKPTRVHEDANGACSPTLRGGKRQFSRGARC